MLASIHKPMLMNNDGVVMTRPMIVEMDTSSCISVRNVCTRSHLVTKDYKAECVVCGGNGKGKYGVYASISTGMNEEALQRI